MHLILVADVHHAGERAAARLLDLRGRRVERAGRASGAARWSWPAMATLAPSRAARSAMASPMPRLAPVMKRVFPWRVGMSAADPITRLRAREGRRSGPAGGAARPSFAARPRGRSTRRCARCRTAPGLPRAEGARRARRRGGPRPGWAGRASAAPPRTPARRRVESERGGPALARGERDQDRATRVPRRVERMAEPGQRLAPPEPGEQRGPGPLRASGLGDQRLDTHALRPVPWPAEGRQGREDAGLEVGPGGGGHPRSEGRGVELVVGAEHQRRRPMSRTARGEARSARCSPVATSGARERVGAHAIPTPWPRDPPASRRARHAGGSPFGP